MSLRDCVLSETQASFPPVPGKVGAGEALPESRGSSSRKPRVDGHGALSLRVVSG